MHHVQISRDKQAYRWNSNNKKKSSAVAIPMKRDKIEDAYTEHLDDIINLLYEIKTRTIDSEGAIPTDTMRSLREIIRDTLKDHICPRLLQGRAGKSPLMKGLIDQVLYFLPEFTAKFGKSQLEHCMKLTELLINLVQLQIVTPNLLREVDVQNFQFYNPLWFRNYHCGRTFSFAYSSTSKPRGRALTVGVEQIERLGCIRFQ